VVVWVDAVHAVRRRWWWRSGTMAAWRSNSDKTLFEVSGMGASCGMLVPEYVWTPLNVLWNHPFRNTLGGVQTYWGIAYSATCIRIRIEVTELQQNQFENTPPQIADPTKSFQKTTKLTIDDAYFKWL